MRKFGVEIEAVFQSGHNMTGLSRDLAAAGLGGSTHGYLGHSSNSWVLKTDASVHGGCELVSPPLDFDDPAQRGQVTTALEIMQRHTRTSQSAGIHVHVESVSLSPEQIGNLARTWTRFEDVIYRLASSGWGTIRGGARQFAKPLEDRQIVALAKAKTPDAVRAAYYQGTQHMAHSHSHHYRYYGLNLHSHFFRGTVEFRVFNSSLNPVRVQTYIAMCVALIEDAKSGKKRSINKAVRMGQMADGSADAAKAFFQFLSVLRYQAGMSLEDYRNIKKIWADSRAQRKIEAY